MRMVLLTQWISSCSKKPLIQTNFSWNCRAINITFCISSSFKLSKLLKARKCLKLITVCQHVCALLLSRILLLFQFHFLHNWLEKAWIKEVYTLVGCANTCKHKQLASIRIAQGIPLTTLDFSVHMKFSYFEVKGIAILV